MKKGACHHKQLGALRKIEGQVRGILRMVEEERYCVDILNASAAVRGALKRVEAEILTGHLQACAHRAFTGKSRKEKKIKLGEIIGLFETLRK